MSTLSFEKITAAYKKGKHTKLILQDVSLCLNPGEFVCLCGPNGCGKSTLSKLLNGLILPTSGNVFINNLNTKEPGNNLDIKNEKILKIDIEGTVGRSKKIDGIVDKLPVFNKLLPTTLGDNNYILQVYEIATYYDIPNVEFNTLTKNKISDKEMELVKETRYHSIYQKDNYVLVKLKKM